MGLKDWLILSFTAELIQWSTFALVWLDAADWCWWNEMFRL